MIDLATFEANIEQQLNFNCGAITTKHGKYLTPHNIGYLARLAYQKGVLHVIKEIERTPQFMLRYKLRELKECYS